MQGARLQRCAACTHQYLMLRRPSNRTGFPSSRSSCGGSSSVDRKLVSNAARQQQLIRRDAVSCFLGGTPRATRNGGRARAKHRGDDSKRTAGEDMVVDWFQETLSTMQLRFVWWVLIPALSKGKRIGWIECRVERLSKVLMCQTSAVLFVGKGECLKGAKGRDYHCRQVEQPAQFHKLLPLGEQLSLRGDSQSCNSGDPPALPQSGR